MRKLKSKLKILITLCLVILMIPFQSLFTLAENPIVQTIYTADPAPMVDGDTLYVYTSHDEDGSTYFTMDDLMCYSTTDMVNWTDHGAVMTSADFSWAKENTLWASQVIKRNGKYYAYVPIERSSGQGPAIGVAVSDSPTGPFKDPLGEPLATAGTWAGDIDPTVFIDDDGQAYLYWGNPNIYYVKLNEDMISYSGEIQKVPMTVESFGERSNDDRPTSYEEGPWLYKRNDLYYLIFAGGPISEHLAYSTSDSPTGPWTYRGVIMPTQGSSFTNHPAVVDYKGKTYLFYHNGALPGGHGYARSVCIEEFEFNADGTIPVMNMTEEGASAIANLNPYVRNEAETINWESGIETEKCSQGGVNVYDIHNDDYIKVKNVDFDANGASAFTASVSCEAIRNIAEVGGNIELRLDSVDGKLIGTLPVSYTGEDDSWKEITTEINGADGVHDLYFVFKGTLDRELFKFDYWKFTQKSEPRELIALNATTDYYKIDTSDDFNTAKLSVKAIYSDGTIEDITNDAEIVPNKDGIISVENGVITGIDYGDITVTVNYGGKTCNFDMIIADLDAEMSVKSITLDNDTLSLICGNTAKIKVSAEFYDGYVTDVTSLATYESSDPTIASVANGEITGLLPGNVDITISYAGLMGQAATATLKVDVSYVNAYQRIEAETWSEKNGDLRNEACGDVDGDMNVGYIESGYWISYNSIDFGDLGAASFDARTAAQYGGGVISLRLDSPEGQEIGKMDIISTGDWQKYHTQSIDITADVTGVHDLYFVFTGNLNINWWQFNEKEKPPIPEIGITLDKDTYYQNEIITVKATYPSEYTDIGFTNEYGSWMGTSLVDYVDNGNDTATWTMTLAIGTKGNRTINVMNGSDKIGEFNVTILGGYKPEYPDESANIVSVRPAKVAWANDNFTVTVVTRRGASDVKLFNEYGNEFGKTLVSKEIVGNTIEWEFSMNIGSKGVRTVTVNSIDAVGNINDSESFTMAIV